MSKKDDELTGEEIWDQEAALREGTTAQAADPVVQDDQPQSEPDAAPEQSPDATAAEIPPQTGQEEPDPLKVVLDKLEKIEARTRNVEGHIGGLKAQQQQIHQAMEAARSATTVTPNKVDMAEAVKNPEKWEELKKDFPDWADATEELLSARLSGVKPEGVLTKDELERSRQEDLQTIRNEMVDTALNLVLPGWKQEVKTDEFKSWMGGQPDDVKALAQSSDVADAARMLRMYDSFKTNDASERLKTERQQKLAQGAPLPRGSTPAKTKSINDMTPQELWDYEVKKREKDRASRGF